MFRTTSTGLFLATVLLAGAAHAEGKVIAKLESPLAKPMEFIAATAVWNCSGSLCASGEASGQVMDWDQCQDVARKVGRILSYTADEAHPMDAKHLAKCNAAVRSSGAMAAKAAASPDLPAMR